MPLKFLHIFFIAAAFLLMLGLAMGLQAWRWELAKRGLRSSGAAGCAGSQGEAAAQQRLWPQQQRAAGSSSSKGW